MPDRQGALLVIGQGVFASCSSSDMRQYQAVRLVGRCWIYDVRTSFTDSLRCRGGEAFSSCPDVAGRDWPNHAASGNGAVASRFHAEAHRRVVPALRRSPVIAIDSDREAPRRREGRREGEGGSGGISRQRSEPVGFRRRQGGPRIHPSAHFRSPRCSLRGVRAALGYRLDQKANQSLETNADSASLRRHRSAFP
jgi:hypothetical protein